jgi:hypothetical protein
VKAAYVALLHDPEHDKKPTLIVGYHADGDVHSLSRDAGIVAGDCLPAGEFVDFIRVVPGNKGVIHQYFLKSVKPFYERK